ncbi:hypothetical protein GLOIN_2v1720033 [Rhizophagus clarus]|uniref:Uncharacterized protein n=1 Tax=Rhizophagus clarus TaxID=94130 RepID=A0A8H3M0M9_9GLOM|nr:hypothetical protein GLOIN_2v1720033 [Rhizophagus clarus]
MYWQDWELFVAYYEAFISNMLIEREKKAEEGQFVNGKGTPFRDSFIARKMVYDSENSNTLMIVQDKWDYDGKVLTEFEVLKEYVKNLKNLMKKSEPIINYYPDPCCIMILVTMGRCDFDYGQLPEDVLVIDKTNFEKYFGPISSSRAVFCLAKDINPNFLELTKIKNIVPNVGEITSGKIAENCATVTRRIKELEQRNQNTSCIGLENK